MKPSSTVFSLTSRRTEIAKYATGPRLQGLLAESALAQPYLEQEILVTWWQQITKFSVMALNLETVTDTLSWYKIWQLNGSSHIRAKQKLYRKQKLAIVRGADAETQSHLRRQFPRIWQSLRRFILETLSIKHLTAQRRTGLLKEWNFCSIVAIRSGWKMVGGFHGMFLLSAIQFKIPCLMGGHLTKGDSANELKNQ